MGRGRLRTRGNASVERLGRKDQLQPGLGFAPEQSTQFEACIRMARRLVQQFFDIEKTFREQDEDTVSLVISELAAHWSQLQDPSKHVFLKAYMDRYYGTVRYQFGKTRKRHERTNVPCRFSSICASDPNTSSPNHPLEAEAVSELRTAFKIFEDDEERKLKDALESLADRTLDMAFAFHDQATYATAHYNRFREELQYNILEFYDSVPVQKSAAESYVRHYWDAKRSSTLCISESLPSTPFRASNYEPLPRREAQLDILASQQSTASSATRVASQDVDPEKVKQPPYHTDNSSVPQTVDRQSESQQIIDLTSAENSASAASPAIFPQSELEREIAKEIVTLDESERRTVLDLFAQVGIVDAESLYIYLTFSSGETNASDSHNTQSLEGTMAGALMLQCRKKRLLTMNTRQLVDGWLKEKRRRLLSRREEMKKRRNGL